VRTIATSILEAEGVKVDGVTVVRPDEPGFPRGGEQEPFPQKLPATDIADIGGNSRT
jgi:hypothetical protein